MTGGISTVTIIDGDTSYCRSTERLIRSLGSHVEVLVLHSAAAFLQRARPEPPACVVLEVRLPGVSGLGLQWELARRGIEIPLIFITGHGDIRMAVQAMRAGAINFLTKPFREQELLDDIQQAFQRDRTTCEHQRHLASLRGHYELLTSCEREVMGRVVAGLLNKQTAAELGVTEKTVKFHRGHVMRKMQAESVVDLALKAEQLRLLSPAVTRCGASQGSAPHPRRNPADAAEPATAITDQR